MGNDDKFTPKFHEDEWITDNEHSYLIGYIDYEQRRYLFEVGGYTHKQLNWEYIENVDNKYHLWTIEDAKDGDVLADGDLPFIFKKIDSNKYCYAYCGISVDDGFKIESEGKYGEWTWMQDIKPATKEQRDLLFQKMKEAGYKWDAKKKLLKKLRRNKYGNDKICM